jgi:hypothetical protein
VNYEPLIERDYDAARRAVRSFCAEHGAEEGWKAVARFAVLAYAPAQHAKHALLCCLSAWEIREHLGARFEDAVVECAVYAAASRQPWSEPPILDPPRPDPAARLGTDRLEAERWLATSYSEAEYFAAATRDFEDLGHKLIVANAAHKLADLLGEKGRYAALRVGVWEMTAYAGEPYRERGRRVTVRQLVDNMVANRGDVESAHAVFLYDAALQRGLEKRVGDYLASTASLSHLGGRGWPEGPGEGLPIYPYAKDLGAYLKAHSVAKRLDDERIIAAAWENLQHGPSLESFSFA